MVKVTDLQFSMDQMLKKKMDLIIKRCTQPNPKKDAVLLVEGAEGEGKTNLSFQLAYYFSYHTGREFSNKNVFFRAEPLMKFAQETENQIIIYDEPSLDMMSTEWWKKEQMNLIKLLMTARKKRHFFIFNITKFYKFNEYIVVDRALGMVHVYSRKEIEPGRFVYVKKKAIEFLYNSYRSSKKRLYKKFTSFRGTFPDFVEGILDEAEYEKQKNEAIMSIGKNEEDLHKRKLKELKKSVGLVRAPIRTREELAEKIGISGQTLRAWAHLGDDDTQKATRN